MLLGMPGALALFGFHYLPLLGNVIAFQDYQPYLGISESPWVGLSNFAFLCTATRSSSTRSRTP